jgi:predicted GIY-YIG superfamily endonuclease
MADTPIPSTFGPNIFFASQSVLDTVHRLSWSDDGVGYVYALCSQNAFGQYRYVGQSTNPIRRYQEHTEQRSQIGRYGKLWLNYTQEHGDTICMVLVEACSLKDLDAREQHYIHAFGQHYRLHNIGTPYHVFLTKRAELLRTRQKTSLAIAASQQEKLLRQIDSELEHLEASIAHLL